VKLVEKMKFYAFHLPMRNRDRIEYETFVLPKDSLYVSFSDFSHASRQCKTSFSQQLHFSGLKIRTMLVP
jgi:hypothetical protein